MPHAHAHAHATSTCTCPMHMPMHMNMPHPHAHAPCTCHIHMHMPHAHAHAHAHATSTCTCPMHMHMPHAHARAHAPQVEDPVFIVSMVRTGTTILHRTMSLDTTRWRCFDLCDMAFPIPPIPRADREARKKLAAKGDKEMANLDKAPPNASPPVCLAQEWPPRRTRVRV